MRSSTTGSRPSDSSAFATSTPPTRTCTSPPCTLWRFVYGSLLFDGVFNADPHPGNYFFHPGGKVTFLDFGCVSPATAGQEEHAIDLLVFNTKDDRQLG